MKLLTLLITLMLVSCTPETDERVADGTTTAAAEQATTAEASPVPTPRSTPPPERSEMHQLVPVDDAVRNPGFLKFRDQLLLAARAKDHQTVLASIDPNIRTSFGNGGGIEDFKKTWKPEDPNSELWPELTEVLALGGSFLEGSDMATFCAPYTYSDWPDDVDAFEHIVVINPGTQLKASPDAAASDGIPLGYEILRVAEDDPVRGGDQKALWRKVVTSDKKTGWVEADHLRSPVGYRACFSNSPSGWKMNLFVAGD